MAEILCDKVSRGLRPEERAVTVRDAVNGQRSSLRVETEFLTHHNGKYYLPVGVVQEEPQLGLVLIELPQSPDVGDTRLWVRSADFLEPRVVTSCGAQANPMFFCSSGSAQRS